MSEWNYETNKNLDFSKLTENIRQIIQWKYSKCGYEINIEKNFETFYFVFS